jgi:hypothetical protein
MFDTYTHSLEVSLNSIFSVLCFDSNPSYQVRWRIFHLWYYVGAQKVLDFEALWIPEF